jgi:ribosomal protein L11 methyltransferase
MEVLDLGTGSGILAIAAAKLNAKLVLGLDHDKQAVRVARSNVAANNVQGTVNIRQGSLSDVRGSYDLVVINILARVIVEMLQEGLAERIRPEGTLIASGIILDSVPDVNGALEEGGLELVDQEQRGDWVRLVARRA